MFGLGKLFGSENVINKAVDGIYNGVDSIVYTDQEKAERHERLLKLYEPFKLAQRYLMMLVSLPFVSIHVISTLIYAYGLLQSMDGLIVGAQSLATFNNDALLYPFIVIVTFYTGGGAAEGYVRSKLGK